MLSGIVTGEEGATTSACDFQVFRLLENLFIVSRIAIDHNIDFVSNVSYQTSSCLVPVLSAIFPKVEVEARALLTNAKERPNCMQVVNMQSEGRHTPLRFVKPMSNWGNHHRLVRRLAFAHLPKAPSIFFITACASVTNCFLAFLAFTSPSVLISSALSTICCIILSVNLRCSFLHTSGSEGGFSTNLVDGGSH
jgi:hypothetical protein